MPIVMTQIRNAKPGPKPYKMTDEKGLFLLVQPSGGMLWRMKYRIDGHDDEGRPKRIEKKLGLGTYPEVSLKEARERRDEARRMLANGVDPAEQKQRDKHTAKVAAANTFSVVAKAYIAKNQRDGLAEATVQKREWFTRLVEKSLGHRPIAEIQPYEVLDAVRPFEASKNDEKAHRTLQFIGQVFRFAVANQLAPSDPTRDLRGALAKRSAKHHAAILDPGKAGEMLRAIDGYEGHPSTRIALQLSALLFVRPGELRRAEWSEVDLASNVWRIPAAKMKARQEHAVPLCRQAIALFNEAKVLSGGGRYVFPSIRSPLDPMSENTVNAALRRLGFTGDEMTAHGFRAMASTLLNESNKWSPDAIERALAHKDKDTIRAAYHRGAHWAERVEMAQWWADYLDRLRDGAEILPFSRNAMA